MHKTITSILLFGAATILHFISCLFIGEIIAAEVFEYRFNRILIASLIFLVSLVYFSIMFKRSGFEEKVIFNAALVEFLFDISFFLYIISSFLFMEWQVYHHISSLVLAFLIISPAVIFVLNIIRFIAGGLSVHNEPLLIMKAALSISALIFTLLSYLPNLSEYPAEFGSDIYLQVSDNVFVISLIASVGLITALVSLFMLIKHRLYNKQVYILIWIILLLLIAVSCVCRFVQGVYPSFFLNS